MDEPELIMRLIQEYPEFEPLYQEMYGMCRNMEDFMGIFSEELAILDKNTVDYMIDEMQNTIDEQKETINGQREKINTQKGTIDILEGRIEEMEKRQRLYQESLNQLN